MLEQSLFFFLSFSWFHLVVDGFNNYLMYADDSVVLSRHTAGLQQLLRVWPSYGFAV